MRRNGLAMLLVLSVVLVMASAIAVVARTPTPDASPDGPFDPAYVAAAGLMADARRPENAARRESLLSDAIDKYTESLAAGPENPSALISRGVAYSYLGEQDRAIDDFTAALRLAPGSADAVKDRGIAYEAQGKSREALADYEAFLGMIADAPSERRAEERATFAEKARALRSQLGTSKDMVKPRSDESVGPLGGVGPEW